jgi:hypothetical protein
MHITFGGWCMCRNMVSVAAAATVVLVLLAGLQCADAERKTKGDVNLRDCDPDNDGYYPPPSPSNCPKIIKVVPKGAKVYPICKAQGGNVNGDKWWRITMSTSVGWFAHIPCAASPYSHDGLGGVQEFGRESV